MFKQKKDVLLNIINVLETGSKVLQSIELEIKNKSIDNIATLINDICLMYDTVISALKPYQNELNLEVFLEKSFNFEARLKEILKVFEEERISKKIIDKEFYCEFFLAFSEWKANIQFEVIKSFKDFNFNKNSLEIVNTLEKNKKKVLIGSPIHQKPSILNEFLLSLSRLNKTDLEITFLFIDDNNNKESSKLLEEFSGKENNVVIYKSDKQESYICDNVTHRWKESLIWKVAEFKNIIIKICLENNFDYLYLIDSDIILHPNTLEHLISTNKDIISEIFWTKWKPNMPELPQVWLSDQYGLYIKDRSEEISANEILIRQQNFINQLRKPGIYEVGGLGACTLISREALKKGVNFEEIKNLSFWGEDRHFCVRASALGLNLYVDTHYPAYHLYRDTDLEEGLILYKENVRN